MLFPRFLLFFGLFCFLFMPGLQAQYVIKGTISDKNNDPVMFATITLQRTKDSSIIITGLADSAGKFTLQNSNIKETFITVSAPGYIANAQKITDSSSKNIILQFTLKGAEKLLANVTITAKKPLIERRPDRIIFNVADHITSDGSDAMNVLKKAPGVRVRDGEISISGKSTVTVMLNEKLLQLSGDELIEMLSSIPAGNILRIEIITAPPAKYDASGNSGIINIVTKHPLSDGFNGNVTTGYLLRSHSAPFMSANVNYKQGKVNVYANMSSAYFRSVPVSAYTIYYPQQRWEQNTTQQNLYPYVRLQAGADYTFTTRSTIGFLYTLGASSPVYEDDTKTRVFNLDANAIDSVLQTKAKETGSGVRNVFNLNYEYRIDSMGKKLNVDFDYFTRNGQHKRDFATDDVFADGSSTGVTNKNRTDGTQVVNIKSIKADLNLPAGWAKFTLGAKASFTENSSDNHFAAYNGSIYANDPLRSNTFEYTEYVQSLYGSIEKSFNKLSMQAGLRAEHTRSKGYSPTLAIANNYKYLKLFPSLFFQYSFNEDNELNLNFTRRIQRPDFMLLNPFRYYSNTTSYETGNPFLQPSYSNNIEIGYTLRSRYTLNLFFQRVTDLFAQVMNVDTTDDGYHFTNANVGTELNYGISFNAVVNPAPAWESAIEFYAYYTHFNSSYYSSSTMQSYTRPSFNISTNNTFFLNGAKTLSAELDLDYEAKELSQFSLQYQTFNMEVGVKALLFRKRLSVALNIEDIFATDRYRLRNLYNGSVTNNYGDNRLFRISIGYKFGTRANVKNRPNTSGIEERQGLSHEQQHGN
ncbi:MAG: hypothetical protein BGO69_03825 [Bacteroidetes bacterium 46-16]|nr:MAG: hypothetical protein BGO69_03825 [Bacteroidetes bacterium 46-16]